MFTKNKGIDGAEYVIEFCLDMPVCGVALFRNNPQRDFRGKFYNAEDYVYSEGVSDSCTIESETLFVSDSPNPYVFNASDCSSAVTKYRKYVKKLRKSQKYLNKYCGIG